MTSRKPGFDGDYLRFRNIFPLLSQTNDITLLYLDLHGNPNYFQTFADYFSDVERVRYDPHPPSVPARIFDFLTLQPEQSLKRKDPALLAQLKHQVSALIERKRIELVFSWVRDAAQFLKHAHVPVLFDLCDALSLQLHQELPSNASLRKQLYYHRVKRFESKIVANYPVTFVSQKDANWFSRRMDVTVIPNGVDLSLKCESDQAQEPDSIIFSGSMGFTPNIEAALYFADAILPHVIERCPNLRWYIVGADPIRDIMELGKHPNVVVTGMVESVADYICRAQVVINPMISGSGIKNKVLEAMSLGRPVVSTSLGIDGIACTNGESGLIADQPQAFAEAVLHLLADEKARRRLASSARQLVATGYAWTGTAQNYETLFDRLIGHHSATNRKLQ